MIDDIRNWIGDIASGAINERRIALSQQEAAVFKRQLDDAVSEISILRAENARLTAEKEQLESENQELKSKLAAIDEHEEIDDQAYQILCALFDHGPYLDLPSLQNMIQLSRGVTESHMDELKRRNLIVKRPAMRGPMKSVPVTAGIIDAGRAFVMARRKTEAPNKAAHDNP